MFNRTSFFLEKLGSGGVIFSLPPINRFKCKCGHHIKSQTREKKSGDISDCDSRSRILISSLEQRA